MRAVLLSFSIPSRLFSLLVVALTSATPAIAGEGTGPVQPFVARGSQGSEHLEVTLRTYTLPNDLQRQASVETLLSSEVGVAGTELVGMRVILAVPDHLRFDRMEVSVADGLFLVREQSMWRSAGRYLMTVARWLLIGRLFSGGDDLKVSATTWTMLLGNEMLSHDPVMLDREDRTSFDREDDRITHHGRFAVCRMVVARNAVTELINMTIWATEVKSGQPMRFTIPRLTLPREEG